MVVVVVAVVMVVVVVFILFATHNCTCVGSQRDDDEYGNFCYPDDDVSDRSLL